MQFVQTDRAPQPAGHYAQAIISGHLVFVSGQLPIDPNKKDQKPGDIIVQTRQALNNLEAILLAAGCTRENVCKTTVFISDITLWDKVNKVYADFFGAHKPARAVVPTRDLHFGFKVEIEAVTELTRSAK